ncbi:tRNA epoxyqueuosine(34) reductase QueG [Natronospira bacteriovora]|uniref:Epoxyqueuosine reductase n=1 Tax=Natronospira bacteriovora TaxID=3069753 RepID=A0ABU0W5V7_9GAMM|nr:tRNA epoxyqueuosine(34) reductase QueG [Natronospira sp. AB-CW4]MDQ2069397.1 tRNA epoxyqueuosine(34) reductase QueG [Natronospira sp. AB-CW4]
MNTEQTRPPIDYGQLAEAIRGWGLALGFQAIGISDIDLRSDEARLDAWLADGRHGSMEWMARHGHKRSRPDELLPGTCRVISARMDYLPAPMADSWTVMADGTQAFVSRYALGRDYHKLLRKRLQQLADHIRERVGAFGYRAFVDSAPVMEKPLAQKAGLGWVGKHTNVLHEKTGSWFFLGELYTDLPLPVDEPGVDHCGSCRRCIDACPTGAITGPYRLDARKCISYLTIEHNGAIPERYRRAMGNRIYGCDDCQLVCPWNKFARYSEEQDFLPREGLDQAQLTQLFAWSEAEFLRRLEGSAIRRIGHERWLRNIAVALGNAPSEPGVQAALKARLDHPSALVREHVEWALEQHSRRLRSDNTDIKGD